MQDFLGMRGKVGAVPIRGETSIEFIVSGEDVFDLGAQFGFLKS